MRTVRPSPQWQDSLIRIEKGQRVVIDAEETWSPDMRTQIAWWVHAEDVGKTGT